MTALRPYQLAAIDRIRDAIRAGHRRILLVLPTGAGKTLTAASMLASALGKGSRSMFVAHRLELIDQTVSTFARLGIDSIGVIRSGDKRQDVTQPIQVASIQTLVRRRRPEANVVFIDEAHRAMAPSYERAIFQAYPDAVIVGITATPCRGDGKPLDRFSILIEGATYSQLLAEGHLVEPMVYSTPVLPDLTSVRTSGGDFNAEDLERAVNTGALIGNLGEAWQRHAEGRRTVVFAVGVAHSQAIVAMFRGLGVRAEHVDGTTPETERRAILARLASGETTVVSNVGVLCEGWDLPSCKCLMIARPTKSLGLYMQMAGRILRPWEGATPIIFDHGGNVDRVVNGEPMGMPHQDRVWSLDGKPKRAGSMPVKMCRACFAQIQSALMICPHCGYEFPAPASSPVEETEHLTAVELALRSLAGDDAELSYFRALTARARDKHWKPGAVYHRFVERFGHEPPREWTRALRSGFKRDVEWKAAIDERVSAFEETGT